MLRIVLPAPLSDVLRNVYLSFVMHVTTLIPSIHRGIGGLGIAIARKVFRRTAFPWHKLIGYEPFFQSTLYHMPDQDQSNRSEEVGALHKMDELLHDAAANHRFSHGLSVDHGVL